MLISATLYTMWPGLLKLLNLKIGRPPLESQKMSKGQSISHQKIMEFIAPVPLLNCKPVNR